METIRTSHYIHCWLTMRFIISKIQNFKQKLNNNLLFRPSFHEVFQLVFHQKTHMGPCFHSLKPYFQFAEIFVYKPYPARWPTVQNRIFFNPLATMVLYTDTLMKILLVRFKAYLTTRDQWECLPWSPDQTAQSKSPRFSSHNSVSR